MNNRAPTRMIWITPKFPLGTPDGARHATCILIRHLAQLGVDIDLVCLLPKTESGDAEMAKSQLGVAHSSFITRSSSKLLPLPPLRIPFTLRSFATSKIRRAFQHRLTQLLENTHSHCPTYVIFDGLHPFAALPTEDLRNLIRNCDGVVYRAHNFETALWEQCEKTARAPWMRWLFRYQTHLVKQFERHIAQEVPLIASVSQEDITQFKSLAPQANTISIPIGIDFPDGQAIHPVNIQAKTFDILFIGRLDWIPNRNGLLWFLQEVWPSVAKQRPNACLKIAGVGDGRWLHDFLTLPRLSYLGRVDHLGPAYEESAVTIAPLFQGSGTRVKILESARYARATVSTALGAQGSGLISGHSYYGAETKQDWIKTLTTLSLSECRNTGLKAFEEARRQFDGKTIAERFLHTLKQIGLSAAGLMIAIGLLHNSSFAASSNITAIWANTGEDKVTQEELRATQQTGKTVNSVWNGQRIALFGARNETVAFNVILEAGMHKASHLSVSFNQLKGPSGSAITSSAAQSNGLSNWIKRPIELFYVRYLPINGLSLVSYDTYDERQIPQRMRRPWSSNGVGTGTWQDRPDHNKYYPDIAVPLELVPSFSIEEGHNQSIWVDIYIPKNMPPGLYQGQLTVHENGILIKSIPVQLTLYNFTLPDSPNAKTMAYLSSSNIEKRYIGRSGMDPNSPEGVKARLLRDRYFLLAHRHRISLIGDSPDDCRSNADEPCPEWLPRLDGSLFTPANGYDGPGIHTGNGIYAIGTYGSWSWKNGNEMDMQKHADHWATWFSQYAPHCDYFLYLADESKDVAQLETWAEWILRNPGVGKELKSMATLPLPTAAAQAPSLDIPTSTLGYGIPSQWEPLVHRYTHDPRKRFYVYNGHRPASGSFAIEDDGVALRELAWVQYKEHINRWFYWETTYYNNYQGGTGETDLFKTAQTFGSKSSIDPIRGETGWNYGNGDGVLIYPGTDTIYPSSSYGVDVPFASLRLKFWRRGIQDVDYLTLAAAIDPTKVQSIVDRMVPQALWEYGVNDPNDPTWVRTGISWSINPDVWEKAREQLADIITKNHREFR